MAFVMTIAAPAAHADVVDSLDLHTIVQPRADDGDPALVFEVRLSAQLVSCASATVALSWEGRDGDVRRFEPRDDIVERGDARRRFVARLADGAWDRYGSMLLVARLVEADGSGAVLALDWASLSVDPVLGTLRADSAVDVRPASMDGEGEDPWGDVAVAGVFDSGDTGEGSTGDGVPVTSISALQWIDKPSPSYPAQAKRQGIEGDVVVELLFGVDGVVERATVVSGPELLRPAALAAVRQWRARPLRKDGEVTRFRVTAKLKFKLTD